MQQDDGHEGEHADAEIATDEQLHAAERRPTTRMIQAFLGQALDIHDMVLSF